MQTALVAGLVVVALLGVGVVAAGAAMGPGGMGAPTGMGDGMMGGGMNGGMMGGMGGDMQGMHDSCHCCQGQEDPNA